MMGIYLISSQNYFRHRIGATLMSRRVCLRRLFQGSHAERFIVEVSPTSLELIDYVTHTSLELVPTRFICSPPSPFLKSSLIKPLDNDVITTLNDELSLVDIEIELVEGGL